MTDAELEEAVEAIIYFECFDENTDRHSIVCQLMELIKRERPQ